MNMRAFLTAVTTLEQQIAAELHMEPLALVPLERIQAQWEQGLPLLPLVPPHVPALDFLARLTEYRVLLAQHRPDLAPALAQQAQALADAPQATQTILVAALLHGDNGSVYDVAEDLGIEAGQLYFLGELALRPYLSTYAERLETVVDFATYHGGRCPVCGRRPIMGRIDAENVKHLHCPACETSWRFGRVECPTCGCREGQKLGFFTVEGDDERRVEHCAECGDYYKVINQRVRARKLNFLIEDAETVHLDQLAGDEGYVRGGRIPILQ